MLDRPRRDVWTPIAGVAFVILFVVGVLFVSEPDTDSSDATAIAYFNSHAHRLNTLLAMYLLMFAGAFFLWFIGGLRARLGIGADPGARLPRIAYAGGVLSVGLLWVSAAAFAAVPAAKSFGGTTTITNGDIVRLMPQFGYGTLTVGSMFGAIVLIDAASVVIMRTRILPRWLAWLGFVCTVVLLLSPLFIPLAALLVWVLAASYVLWALPAVEAEPALAVATPNES